MAWRFVKQPNGKLARFSDVVDHFTHYDLSVRQAVNVNLALEYWRDEAVSKVRAGERDLEPFTTRPGDGLSRWRAALAAIERVHGAEERGVCERWAAKAAKAPKKRKRKP